MPMTRRGRGQGLTFVEVLVATAIVMLTCAAVTAATITAARAGRRGEQVAAADQAMLAEAARLRALPFFAPLPIDWPELRAATTPSAVGDLFPHADSALNSDGARFVSSGDLAGAFETSAVVGGVTLRRLTWMVACDGSGWRCVAAAALDGWHAWGDAPMPAEGLLVRLEAPQGDMTAAAASSPSLADGTSVRSLSFVLGSAGGPSALDVDAMVAGEDAGL